MATRLSVEPSTAGRSPESPCGRRVRSRRRASAFSTIRRPCPSNCCYRSWVQQTVADPTASVPAPSSAPMRVSLPLVLTSSLAATRRLVWCSSSTGLASPRRRSDSPVAALPFVAGPGFRRERPRDLQDLHHSRAEQDPVPSLGLQLAQPPDCRTSLAAASRPPSTTTTATRRMHSIANNTCTNGHCKPDLLLPTTAWPLGRAMGQALLTWQAVLTRSPARILPLCSASMHYRQGAGSNSQRIMEFDMKYTF
jgi:hypothetical protein